MGKIARAEGGRLQGKKTCKRRSYKLQRACFKRGSAYDGVQEHAQAFTSNGKNKLPFFGAIHLRAMEPPSPSLTSRRLVLVGGKP